MKGVYDGVTIHHLKNMANELVVWDTVKNISSIVNLIITTYRRTNYISKLYKQQLRNKIEEYMILEKLHSAGIIAQNNIYQIEKTMRLINNLELEGIAYSFAIDQLETLNKKLQRLLEDF